MRNSGHVPHSGGVLIDFFAYLGVVSLSSRTQRGTIHGPAIMVYLQRADAYALDPALPLQAGQHQTALGQPLFGAMSDCAPDGWGRRVVRRQESHRAQEADTQQRGLLEVDFLLGARDDLRQGALRFRERSSEQYLAIDAEGVLRLVDLSRRLNATEELERDNPTSEDLRLLLHGGSSLGGARPKAHVLDIHGRLAIAKFPSPSADEWDVIRWEAVALTLAKDAGITAPENELHVVDDRPVLVVRHGFLRTSTSGWSLSPTFDLNPNPEGQAKRLATAIDENRTEASLTTALEVAGLFRVSKEQSEQIIDEVATAIGRWREVARANGLNTSQIERLAPAFEHEQSITARELLTSRR